LIYYEGVHIFAVLQHLEYILLESLIVPAR